MIRLQLNVQILIKSPLMSLVPTAWLQTIFGLGEIFCCHLGGGQKNMEIQFQIFTPLINNEHSLRHSV